MSDTIVNAPEKTIVGVADLKLGTTPGEVLVTHALGSCLGIAIHDPVACVGGLLHVMLPLSSVDREKARKNPLMFVDTGLPKLFKDAYARGAVKKRLIVKVAGGANVHKSMNDRFDIGRRNMVVFKRMLWKNGVYLGAEDVGGSAARTMYLQIGSGRVWVSARGEVYEI
jgi:chemotaxis protein CheD